MRHHIAKFVTIIIILCNFPALADDFEFSGYVRIIGGYLDEKHAEYKGYDNNINFKPASLIGVQADYHFNDNWSLTGQFVARTDNSTASKNSGLEWLYITYRATDNLQIKLGKLRAPFFAMSDFSDVGFAYPWINPPQQVYDTYMFKTFNGIDAIYKFATDNFDISIEGYYGAESGDVDIGTKVTGFKADNLMGIIGKLNVDNLEFRVAKYNTDLQLDINRLSQLQAQLRQFNFNKSADSIKTDGDAYAEQFSMIYDNLDYFFRAEWIKIKTDLAFVPKMQSYYLTAGFNHSAFTYHLTFGDSDVKIGTAETEIPLGVNPSLDQLAMAYQGVFIQSQPDALKTWTLGARWDVLPNLALKVEFSTLEGRMGENSFFTIKDGADFDRKANLYLIGLDWVF
ncbi:hypothetical protein [Pseudoalteromonas sp.]|uniref:hypothetical protein n=1 Tax=Pseudoalteromonas sp. TaxID=53249 RepID=UPI0035670FB5